MQVATTRHLCSLLLAASLLPKSARADIGPVVNPANGHSYYVTEGSMTWAQAEAWAVSKGGHLVAVNDAVEDSWIHSNLGLSSGYYWLGANDAANEGVFTWVTGEAFTFQNFVAGEPDDDASLGGGGDYLALSAASWGWLDTNGSFTGFVTGAIAERPAPTGIGPFVNPANGHAYYVNESAMTWAQAEAWAVSDGGHLVSINNSAEDVWMHSHLGLSSGYYWLGGRDTAVEGVFAWVSGEPFSYQNFIVGEPDDDVATGGGGDYLALSAANWGWLDTNGTLTGLVTGAIAEVASPTGVGTPSAAMVHIVARPSVTSDLMRLSFALPAAAQVRMRIYDVRGRLVRTLASSTLGAGSHELTWDTQDNAAQRVPSGVYFVQLQIGHTSTARKVIVSR